MRFFYGNELEPRARTLKFSTNHHESWKMLICLQHLPTILPKLPAPTRLRQVNYCCRGNGTDLHQLRLTGTSQCQSCGNRLRLTWVPQLTGGRDLALPPGHRFPWWITGGAPAASGPWGDPVTVHLYLTHLILRSLPTCSSWQQQHEDPSSGPGISFGLFENFHPYLVNSSITIKATCLPLQVPGFL